MSEDRGGSIGAHPKLGIGLAILQGVGALNLLLYPGVFLASVMGLSGSGPKEVSAGVWLWKAFLLASFVYPLLWAVLWGCSWLAFRKGKGVLAMALSLPPALVSVTGGAFFVWQMLVGQAAVKKMVADNDAEMRGANPLVAGIFAFDSGRLPWAQLEKEIATADASLLSKPAGLYGTPLRLSLVESRLMQTLDFAQTRPHCLEAARLLISRGATLSAEEEALQEDIVWMAGVLRQGITLPDRSAEKENPLVWVILSGSEEAPMAAIEAVRRDPSLLHKATRSYGTPLAVALLLRNRGPRADGLLYSMLSKGARLSETERNVPSLVQAFEQQLSLHPTLKEKYASQP